MTCNRNNTLSVHVAHMTLCFCLHHSSAVALCQRGCVSASSTTLSFEHHHQKFFVAGTSPVLSLVTALLHVQTDGQTRGVQEVQAGANRNISNRTAEVPLPSAGQLEPLCRKIVTYASTRVVPSALVKRRSQGSSGKRLPSQAAPKAFLRGRKESVPACVCMCMYDI